MSRIERHHTLFYRRAWDAMGGTAKLRNDNLSSIAAKYGTTWQTLKQINGLANKNLIYPGQVLRLP